MLGKEDIVDTNPEIINLVIKANKNFPNNKLPLIIYRSACQLGKQKNKAAKQLQVVFRKHHWTNTWSNGIYTFHHYHSNTHEVLGICSGKVRVIFGGPSGKTVILHKGDIVIIPAGVGHKCSKSSDDFLCVGAYPEGKQYDINLGTRAELLKAKPRIAKIPMPTFDPVYGKEGFLKTFWK